MGRLEARSVKGLWRGASLWQQWPMTGTELFPIVEDASKSLRQAMGTTLAEVWQGIVGDKVVAWRITNAAKINERLRTELATTGASLNLAKIPPGVAFTWFEKATQADEPEIQALFAKLLANAAAGNEEALVKRNIDLVSRLAPDDARLLEILKLILHRAFKWAERPRLSHVFRVDWNFTRLLQEHNFEDKTSIDALISLGILRLEQEVSADESDLRRLAQTSGRRPELAINSSENLILTTIGMSLIDALFPITLNDESGDTGDIKPVKLW